MENPEELPQLAAAGGPGFPRALEMAGLRQPFGLGRMNRPLKRLFHPRGRGAFPAPLRGEEAKKELTLKALRSILSTVLNKADSGFNTRSKQRERVTSSAPLSAAPLGRVPARFPDRPWRFQRLGHKSESHQSTPFHYAKPFPRDDSIINKREPVPR